MGESHDRISKDYTACKCHENMHVYRKLGNLLPFRLHERGSWWDVVQKAGLRCMIEGGELEAPWMNEQFLSCFADGGEHFVSDAIG